MDGLGWQEMFWRADGVKKEDVRRCHASPVAISAAALHPDLQYSGEPVSTVTWRVRTSSYCPCNIRYSDSPGGIHALAPVSGGVDLVKSLTVMDGLSTAQAYSAMQLQGIRNVLMHALFYYFLFSRVCLDFTRFNKAFSCRDPHN